MHDTGLNRKYTSYILVTGLVNIIKSDTLIQRFGYHQLLRKGENLSFEEINQIRAKLRAVARLLTELRKQTGKPTISLSSLFSSEYYDKFVSSVLTIREKNKQLAFTIGHYIKQLCVMNISLCNKVKDYELKQLSKDFLDDYNSSWVAVSASTRRLQKKTKINKTIQLPTLADLKEVTEYIAKEMKTAAHDRDYSGLQKLLLAHLIMFNKRRPAEVANLTISDYRLSLSSQEDREEILQSLSPAEKSMAER